MNRHRKLLKRKQLSSTRPIIFAKKNTSRRRNTSSSQSAESYTTKESQIFYLLQFSNVVTTGLGQNDIYKSSKYEVYSESII